MKLGKGFMKATFEIDQLQLQDKWTLSPQFSYIVDTLVASKNKLEEDRAPKVFRVIIDQNVTYEITPLRIKVASEKTLFLCANMPAFKELGRCMAMATAGDKFDFSFFKDLAGMRVVEYRE